MGRLDGKVAIVLGAAAAGNMGQAIARRFAAEGARVMVAGRHEAPLAALASELGGTHALCDITRKAELEALVAGARQQYGRVDIGVNCTGWGILAKLLETTEEQIDRAVALHFKGTFFFLQSFVGAMAAAGGGALITISSASVYALLHHHAAYIGTKAGADALVRCFANEFGAKGVRVNAIAPGLTATPMTQQEMRLPGLEAAFLNEYPLGRIGTVDDVAAAAVWLADDQCFMTGQVLQVNGGLTLRRNPLPREINAALKAAAPRAGTP
ncbi:MAG: SDR family oxidoreductase [Proteobacteria bacterium]|nr:SDR family oxidoreductase [Pseudomonadota bacterium]